MINYHVADGNLLSRRHDAELSIALFVNIFRGVLGSGWHPLEIHFEHAKPTNTRDHRRFLGCDVFFLSQPMRLCSVRHS